MENNETTNVENTKTSKSIIPKLFINKSEQIEVSIYIMYDNTGDIIAVLSKEFGANLDTLDKDVLKWEEYKFTFSKPNYDDLATYRRNSLEYDPISKTRVVSPLKLRDFFLVNHLKDWDLKDENGNKVELKFDVNNVLSNETIDLVYNLHPTIVDVCITAFEKKMVLV